MIWPLAHLTGLEMQIEECQLPSDSERVKKYSTWVIINLVHSETGSTSLGRPSILDKTGKFQIIFSSIIIPPGVKMQQLLNVSSPVADWTEENQLKKTGAAKSRRLSQYDDVKNHILPKTRVNRIMQFAKKIDVFMKI